LPWWTIKAQVIVTIFIAPQNSTNGMNDTPRFLFLSQPNLKFTWGTFAPCPISNFPYYIGMPQIINPFERWFLPTYKTYF
jgi:hypothetical protein